MCIFTYDQREEKYVEVNDLDSLKLVDRMIRKEIPWVGEQAEYFVKLSIPMYEYFPLPLVFAEVKELKEPTPLDIAARAARDKVLLLLARGPIQAKKMPRWEIPVEYFDHILAHKGCEDYDFHTGDIFIEGILRHRGEDPILSIAEKAGYRLYKGAPEFALRFDENMMKSENRDDFSKREEVCLNLAAYSCTYRANEESFAVNDQCPQVARLIELMRSWLKELNAQ